MRYHRRIGYVHFFFTQQELKIAFPLTWESGKTLPPIFYLVILVLIAQLIMVKMSGDWDVSWFTFIGWAAVYAAIPVGIEFVWRMRKAAIIADYRGFLTPDNTRYDYSLLTTVQSIPNTNGKTVEISLLHNTKPIVLCHHVPVKNSELFVTLLRNLVDVRYDRITHIAFGELPFTPEEASATLQNPDVTRLELPLYRLRQVCIHIETCKSLDIEQFLTYAVSILGEPYLKHEVEVVLHGNPAKLPSYLQNALSNLCKKITWYEDLSTSHISPRGMDIEKMIEEEGCVSFFLPRRNDRDRDTKSFFAVWSFMLAIAMSITFHGVMSANPKVLGLIPFELIFGIVWSICFVKLFRRIRLALTPEWLSLHYTILGIEYSRRLPMRSLHVDTYNPKWSRGINLHAGKKTWRFGLHLTAAECTWLTQEIREYAAHIQKEGA